MDEQQVLAVGDHARLISRDRNQHGSYKVTAAEIATSREPVDGMVLSIRDVQTGQLVARAEGNLDRYVVEVVYVNTFNPRFASTRNAPRGVENPMTTGAWKRLRATLRKAAGEEKLFSTATAQAGGPLAEVLDGWRVAKLWANEIESLEQPETAAEAPAE